MGALGRQKDSYRNVDVFSGNSCAEGTSARTRPISLEEVLLRRNAKKLETDAREPSSKAVETFDKNDSGGGSTQLPRDISHTRKSNSRDAALGGSRKKQEMLNDMGEDRLQHKHKEKQDQEPRSHKEKQDQEPHRLKEKQDQEHHKHNEKQAQESHRHKEKQDQEPHRHKEKQDQESHRHKEKPDQEHQRHKEKQDQEHQRHKEKQDQEPNIELKRRHEKSSSENRSRNAAGSQRRNRTDDFKGDFDKQSRSKRSKDVVDKDRDKKQEKYVERENRSSHQHSRDSRITIDLERSSARKSDSSKLQDQEHPKRSRRQEESKSRRKRSRSQEPHYRRGKSISPPPRSFRPSHRDGSSSHSFKGTSERRDSDLDKHKTSRAVKYENRNYRQQGSGLGGYLPRKRRVETAAKSPSLTRHSPEKRVATWDLPPADTKASNMQTSSSAMQISHTSLTASSSTLKSQSTSLPDAAATLLNMPADTIELTQATRPMRRLYIENLPSSVSDNAVIEWLNGTLLSSSINHTMGTPCISCIVNKDKCQGVVEFLTPEDATAALSFNGRSFSGSILKIRRPKDFIDATIGIPDKPRNTIDAYQANNSKNASLSSNVNRTISDIVKDSPDKIVIAGISKSLLPGMLMEIISTFGSLKAYHFEINDKLKESCAFLEYVDQSVTLKAVSGLNGMKLGGRMLVVAKALSVGEPDEENVESHATYNIPQHVMPLLQHPTEILKIQNVFTLKEFLNLPGAELDETLEDIRLECARFGTVKSINVARPTDNFSIATGDFKKNLDKPEGLEAEVEVSRSDSKSCGNVELENERKDDEKVPHNSASSIEIKDRENKESSGPSPVANDANNEARLLGHLTEAPPPIGDAEANTIKEVSDKEDSLSSCIFEPGSVIVEFLRKEACQMAAHILNGRLYGDRTVAVSYIPHDAYKSKFP